MRRTILNVLLIVLTTIGFAQDPNNWRTYIKEDFTTRAKGKEQVYLVEGTISALRNSVNSFEVIRSIDKHHHIVKGIINDHQSWSVNPQWKLNIEPHKSVKNYYVVVSGDFEASLLDHFKILKAYPERNTFLIEGTYKKIEERLLPNAEVYYITNKVYSPFVESRVIDMNLNPNRVNRIHHTYPELDGVTETVSIQENNFNIEDIDILNRSLVSGLESEIVDNHATEMATIIAGNGNSFVTGRGVASNTTIISSDFLEPMPDPDQHYLDFNINTQNHSYGIIRANEYGVEARAFDQSAYLNRNLLHVFSSGNQGEEVSTDGTYSGVQGFANLTGNMKMSKNSLVVGSVDTVGQVPSFVSRGPAYDGRVKPEVVAYSVVGSSNSAALVSGVATLLQQQYRSEHSEDMPSALMKALIINGAKDVGPQGLDYLTGYGNVDAWRSLDALINDRYVVGSVADGDIESFVLNLPPNAVNMKVTLCWTDPPANVNDFAALVNDLDLRILDGTSTTLPWVLDSSPNAADLAKAATRGVDNLNNVEQVTIANPVTTYTIEVEGSEVLTSQDYYISWQYELEDTFEWDFPTGSDNMPYNGETGSYFRWTTTKTGVGILSYTTDEVNWTVLDDNIDLSDGYWRWNNPPLIGDDVRARMEIGSESFETEVFTVSRPLSTAVGFNCGDSLMLKWAPAANAESYTIYDLGPETLETFATTSDTFLVVPNISTLSTNHFSIQPNLPSGKTLLASPTFDYTLQGVDCYIFSFFQTIALDTGIYLNLSLGTTYGMDRIVFERNNLSSFEEIATISTFEEEEYSFLDENPNQGFNEHRVTIYFINGEVLTLSAGTSFYLTEEPVRIFPNPIQSGEEFTVLTKEFDERTPLLELVDHEGAIIYQREIQGTLDAIPTYDFESGIYIYRLYADGEVHIGRVLIR